MTKRACIWNLPEPTGSHRKAPGRLFGRKLFAFLLVILKGVLDGLLQGHGLSPFPGGREGGLA